MLKVALADSSEESYIILLYEKLPNFCYACGKLGHIMRDCEDHSVDKVSLAFGSWIRAPVGPIIRRTRNLMSGNLNANVSSGHGEENVSPSASDPSDPDHLTNLLEPNLVDSGNSNHSIPEEVAPVAISNLMEDFFE